MTRDHHEAAWLAWHTAALGRVKKMPKKFTELLPSAGETTGQTEEEAKAVLKDIFARRRKPTPPA